MGLSSKLLGASAKVGRVSSKYRGGRLAEYAGRLVQNFQYGFANVDFDMHRNGELRVLRIIADQQPKCLFDVGANIGEWSQLALEHCPGTHIHAFEVVPSTFDKLAANVAGRPVTPNPFGLSDTSGNIVIHLGSGGSTDATAFKIEGFSTHDRLYVNEVTCAVRTGADYLTEHRIEEVDFLKIDVEGMDLRVIKGFGDDLSKVRALQFEYGIFNISSHDLLADFCSWLTSRGFAVGKVFPRAVQFFDYDFSMENFHGSNFVAVRQEDQALISALT